MTAGTKRAAIDALESAHEILFDAYEMLGDIKITKETAGPLGEVIQKIANTDLKIAIAIDNLS